MALKQKTRAQTILTAQAVLHILQDHKKELRSLGVQKIGLFGSYLKGNARKKSDLDFLVHFKEIDFDSYMELKFLLEKIYRRKVDLVLDEDLKPALSYVRKEALYAKGL